MTFKELVEALNKKWGHTYLPSDYKDETEEEEFDIDEEAPYEGSGNSSTNSAR